MIPVVVFSAKITPNRWREEYMHTMETIMSTHGLPLELVSDIISAADDQETQAVHKELWSRTQGSIHTHIFLFGILSLFLFPHRVSCTYKAAVLSVKESANLLVPNETRETCSHETACDWVHFVHSSNKEGFILVFKYRRVPLSPRCSHNHCGE
jgi:hypothetical protein